MIELGYASCDPSDQSCVRFTVDWRHILVCVQLQISRQHTAPLALQPDRAVRSLAGWEHLALALTQVIRRDPLRVESRGQPAPWSSTEQPRVQGPAGSAPTASVS